MYGTQRENQMLINWNVYRREPQSLLRNYQINHTVIKGFNPTINPTIKYRRYRGDMIELFNLIKGIYDPTCVPYLDFVEISEDTIRTRGLEYKLVQNHCCFDF